MEMANTSMQWDDTQSNMSSCSSSLEESTSSSTYSSSSDDGDTKMEEAEFEGARLILPQDLCEEPAVFKEMFHLGLWKNFSEENKRHLLNFFPSFPQNDIQEKTKTLRQLFSGEPFQFGVNPLSDFHQKLRAGNFRPDIAKVRALLKRAQYKDYKQSQRRYYYQLMKNILLSRHRLLSAAADLPPGMPLPRLSPLCSSSPVTPASPVYQKVRHRYFKELKSVSQELGESSQSSEDENFPEGPPPKLNKKQKRQLVLLEQSLSPDMNPVTSTLAPKSSTFDLIHSVNPTCNPYEVTEESYKEMLLSHKRRKLNGVVRRSKTPSRSQLKRSSANDVQPKSGTSVNRKQNSRSGETKPTKKMQKSKAAPVPVNTKISPQEPENYESECDESTIAANTLLDVEGDTSPAPFLQGMSNSKNKSRSSSIVESLSKDSVNKVTNASSHPSSRPQVNSSTVFPNLENINMMDLPVDIDESSQIDVEDIKPLPELLKKTHLCFFSLIRDIFCSTWDHRLGLLPLREQLMHWAESPTSLSNAWYSQAVWSELLPSALSFLTGEAVELLPEDFVPYVEYKPVCDAYQWIGAGRDSDARLLSLNQFWMEKRESTATPSVNLEVESNTKEVKREPSPLPPPARCPTSWVVVHSTPEERECFREQERRRFEQPHKAFTYRMHGYEAVVGPVKGMYNAAGGGKSPRGHSLLVDVRPNYVTILALVRDAVARLPNGQGTRADICTLLRDSQYLNTQAQDHDVQNVVSGALDRLHTEPDSSVKYDSLRKNWIYLHRARTEEEFELVHQEMQNMTKTKSAKKVPRAKKATDASTAAGANTPVSTSVSKKVDLVPSTPTAPAIAKPKTIKTLVPNQSAISAAKLERKLSNSPVQSMANSESKSILLNKSPVASKKASALSQGAIMSKLLNDNKSILSPDSSPKVGAKVSKLKTISPVEQVSSSESKINTVTIVGSEKLEVLPKESSAPPKGAKLKTSKSAAAAKSSPAVATSDAVTIVANIVSNSKKKNQTEAGSSGSTVLKVTNQPGVAGRTVMGQTFVTPQQLMLIKQAHIMNKQQQIAGGDQAQKQGQTQMIVINQQQQVLTDQLSLKQQKQIQQLLLKQQQQNQQNQQQQQNQQEQQEQQEQKQQHQPQQLQQSQQINISGLQPAQIQQLLLAKQQLLEQQQKQGIITAGGKQMIVLKQGQQLITTDGKAIQQTQQPMQQMIIVKQSSPDKTQTTTTISQQQLQQLLLKQQQANENKPTSITTTVSQQQLQQLLAKQQQFMVLKQQAGKQGQATQQIKLVATTGGSGASPQQIKQLTQAITTAQLQKMQPRIIATNQRVSTPVASSVQTVTTVGGSIVSGSSLIKPNVQSVMAKVVSTSQPQSVVTMESLLANQKQQAVISSDGSLRVADKASVGSQQFTVVSMSEGQSRVLQTTQLVQTNANLNARNIATKTTGLRVLQGATGINLAQLAASGKPVILSGKAQGIQGQNVVLAGSSSNASGQQTLLLPQSVKQQGGGNALTVLQSGGVPQQILLPAGFQGGTLNIKALQGLKVIPVAQSSQGQKGRPQMFARIISPDNTKIVAEQSNLNNVHLTDQTE